MEVLSQCQWEMAIMSVKKNSTTIELIDKKLASQWYHLAYMCWNSGKFEVLPNGPGLASIRGWV